MKQHGLQQASAAMQDCVQYQQKHVSNHVRGFVVDFFLNSIYTTQTASSSRHQIKCNKQIIS